MNCFLQESLRNCSELCTFGLPILQQRDGALLLHVRQNRQSPSSIISSIKISFRFGNLQYVWYNTLHDVWQPYSFWGFSLSLSLRMIKPDNLTTQMIFLGRNPFPDADFEHHVLEQRWTQQFHKIVVKQQSYIHCGEQLSLITKYSCFVVLAFTNTTKFYVIKRKFLEIPFKRITGSHQVLPLDPATLTCFSWNEASKLCRKFQKILPFFTCKNDVLKMITHLHTLPYYLANCCPKIAEEMLAVYSGLILKGNSKVSECLEFVKYLCSLLCNLNIFCSRLTTFGKVYTL